MKLLSFLPGDCKDKRLIIAVFTLPLGLADEISRLDEQKGVAQSKKSRTSSAVGTCVLDVLKWPRQELECAQAIHDGDVFLPDASCAWGVTLSQVSLPSRGFAAAAVAALTRSPDPKLLSPCE
jgi:hypothetical protein